MPKRNVLKFEVTVPDVRGDYVIEGTFERITAHHIRAYVQDAVRCWGGQFHPGDPRFGETWRKGVRVRPIKAK